MIGQAKRLYELNEMFEPEFSNSDSGRIIAFTSGKGGTGKTFLALNMALALAELDKKVLAVDLDLNFANLNVMLNIVPEKTINNFIENQNELKEIIYEHNSKLHFLFGNSGKLDNAKIVDSFVYGFMKQLRSLSQEYDYIFIDTTSGANKAMISLLGLTDEIIFVTTSEPTAIMDAFVVAKLLAYMEIKNVKRVIVNKSNKPESKKAFDNLSTAVRHFLNEEIQYLGNVEFNENASTSILNQEPFLSAYSNSKTANQITSLGNKIANFKHVVNNSQ